MEKTSSQDYVSTWFKFYKARTDLEYVFTAKDGRFIKLFMKIFSLEDWQIFLYGIKDEWILERLELALIYSKVNVLRQEQRKPLPKERQKKVQSIQEIAELQSIQRFYEEAKKKNNPEA